MPDRIYMVPAPGLRILYPRGGPHGGRVLAPSGAYFAGRLDSDGRAALDDHYWQRRADDGSIVPAAAPADDAALAAPLSPAKTRKGAAP
jgi:hypothetical protein